MDINQLDTKNLPLEPGVYIFKSANDESLYIGKAKNLRSRVKSLLNHISLNQKTKGLM